MPGSIKRKQGIRQGFTLGKILGCPLFFKLTGALHLFLFASICFAAADTVPPRGAILINSNQSYTKTQAAILTLSAYDSGSGLSYMKFSDDNINWSASEAYRTSKPWNLSSGDGTKTVYVKYQDKAGNWSNAFLDTIILDTTAPQGAILINNNAAFTSSAQVTLNFSANDAYSGVGQMQLSNDSINWSSPVAYSTTKTWPLNNASGTKTVYVKFIDRAGNQSTAYSDTIVLDTTPAAKPIVNDEGQTTIAANNLSVTWACDDPESGIAEYQYRITQDSINGGVIRNWTSTGKVPSVTAIGLNLVDNRIYFFAVKAKNGIGFWSNIGYSDGIKKLNPDNVPPTGTIKIKNDGQFTNSTIVTLQLAAQDDPGGSGLTQMQFSNDNKNWSLPESYAVARSWTLASGDGVKTVYVKFRDKAGNWSSVYSDTIALDATLPAGSIFINENSQYAVNPAVNLKLTASDTGSGLAQMSFSNDNRTWSAPEAYSGVKAWTLGSGDGNKIVYAKFKDNAGNWSKIINDSIAFDATAPRGSILINNNAAFATFAQVTLNLSASDNYSGISQMQLSSDNISWASPIAFSTVKAWALNGGGGTKTVYIKYIDRAGNYSAVYSDSIILDTTPPATPVVSDGCETTDDKTKLSASWAGDDPESGIAEYQYRITQDTMNGAVVRHWASTGKTASVTVANLNLIDNKIYFFSVKARNNIGLWSNVGYSDGIRKIPSDTTPPSGTIKINNGAAYTNSLSVNLNLSATDSGSGMGTGSQMQFSNDNLAWSVPEAYATSKAWALLSGDGDKTVYVKFKDTVGNWSVAYSDTIILDATAPAKPQGLSAQPGDKKIDLTWSANGETDLAGYNIYRFISGVDYVKINASLITGNYYQDTGLTNGTTCYYKITAVDNVGNKSVYSEIINATPVAPDDPYEPNNTLETAANCNVGDTVTATIYPVNDPDWYKVNVTKPGLLRIEINNVPVDLCAMLHIYNSSQQDLANKSGNAGETFNVETYLPAAGTYYLKMTARGDEFSLSPYTMKVVLNPAADDIYEPNNTPATAANHNLGDTVTATIYPTNDPDWFKFAVTDPGLLRVEVNNVPDDMAAALRIYNSVLEEKAFNSGNAGDSVSKEIYLSSTGVYYVKVSGRGDDFSLRPYNMKTTLTPATTDPYEPNNTQETAADCNLGDTVTATIYPVNDPDWFKVNAIKPGLLKVDVSNVPVDLCAMLHIYNSSRQDLANKSGNAGESFNVETYLPAAGTYYLKMTARGDEFSLSPYTMRPYFSNLWINDPSISPAIFSPNNDDIKDAATIGATLTAEADWTINIKDSSGAIKRTYQGTGVTIAQAWDGKDAASVVVPDGTYTYTIDAQNATDTALQVKGAVLVDAAYPAAAIAEPVANQNLSGVVTIKGVANDLNFERAYIYYSRGASSTDWRWLNWVGKTGQEPAPLLEWNTKAYPNDDYVLKIEVQDKAGNISSFNVPVKLQNTIPDISELTVGPSPFTPDGIDEDITNDVTKVRFKLSGEGIVTVAIYDKDERLINTLWNDVLCPDPAKGMIIEMPWNGRDRGWALARNGRYKVKVSTGDGQKEASAFVDINDQPVFKSYEVAPKAFSPNDDGVDDISTLSFQISEDSVIGIEVYNSSNTPIKTLGTNVPVAAGQIYNYAWDGKDNSGAVVPQGRHYFKVSVQALTGSIGTPLKADTFLLYLSDIKISRDNFNPHMGESAQIQYRLTSEGRLNIKIYDEQNSLVRNLLSDQLRSSGAHSEVWDGKDNAGAIVPDGAYYFVIEDSISGSTIIVYDPSQTGGEDISHSVSFQATDCDTLANQPSILTYNLPRPAKIDIKVRVERYSGPAIRVIKYQEPVGSGQHQADWDGRDEFGNLILKQSYLVAVWGYTLKDNAFVITGGRPVISEVTANPVKFNPISNPYTTEAKSTTAIFYNLSMAANVALDIYDAGNTLVRRLLDNAPKAQGINSIVWDGKNSAGKILPNGHYRIDIQAVKDGNYSDVATAHAEVVY